MRRLAGAVLTAALLTGCGAAGPCTAKVKTEIQARYAAQVLAACGGKYNSVAACPEAVSLRDQRRKSEEVAKCR